MTPDKKAQDLLDFWQKGNVLAADCPSRPVLQHMTSRWGTLVMITLMTGTHRFSALRRKVGGVSERMLAQTLQLLEADGMIAREAHNVVPPHVDYSLTPLGQQAAGHLLALTGWIEDNLGQILSAHAAGQNAA
ncbi:winged helix-turn-helix transcriptional regulator [Fuscibacter oryzae]|uniref:Helix-turn-helix transcriptional regulator n=1 Tax=Fuscibacter oryzae TaxID=2803939 RepID=A0A8J7STT2_9RHOB|nr:helix-turn-helix domain-containing protein [Fuscibacter oryzae]MBL4927797.1 helix-turn-helix transcriptional regulator [Fuscibacter oryzae]